MKSKNLLLCTKNPNQYQVLEVNGHKAILYTNLANLEKLLYENQPDGFLIDYTFDIPEIKKILEYKKRLQHQYIPVFYIMEEGASPERYKYRVLGMDAVFQAHEVEQYLLGIIEVECDKYETERDRNSNLATFPEIAQAPVCLINNNGDLLYSNNKFYENITWDKWEELKELLLIEKNIASSENQFSRITWANDNKVYLVSIIKNPKRDWYNIYFADITTQKQLETEIKEKTEFYKSILDNIPADIGVFSKDHKYLYVNALGIQNTEIRKWMIGKTDFDYVKFRNSSPELAIRRREYFNNAVTTKKDFEWVDEVKLPDGNIKNIIRRFHPVFDENEELKLMIGYGIDISERIKITNELRHLTDTLSKQNEELRKFTYIISHDLKSPLINLTALVDLLRNPSMVAEAKEQAITMIGNNATKLINTITELASTIQLKDNAISDTKVFFNWYETINEILLSFKYLIDKKSMLVEMGVPVTAEVYFSKAGLQSIIQNLVSNAIKFKVPERKLKVQISLFNTADYQILTISDNGKGIDLNKYGDRLFNLYQRFHPETEGKGLGLYLVRSIIESAGGKIEVDSEVNVGTTFRLYFPNKPLKY
jgi:signal transduction histidine kinase